MPWTTPQLKSMVRIFCAAGSVGDPGGCGDGWQPVEGGCWAGYDPQGP